VELDSGNIVGGFAAFALDSSTFTTDTLDNFEDDGSPLDKTLWYFAVGGHLVNNALVALIDFQLNPLALDEIQFSSSFLASLGLYTDAASEALLINQALNTFIASQVDIDDFTLTFEDVHLFPDDTTFQPLAGGVQYANGVAAVVSAVPEPPPLAILAVGLLGIAAFRRSRTKPSTASTSTPFP
jgi:hypothetical protein